LNDRYRKWLATQGTKGTTTEETTEETTTAPSERFE
jgi:hypothetical protein